LWFEFELSGYGSGIELPGLKYFKPPSNLRDSFMPYCEVNLHFFEQSTNMLLLILEPIAYP